MIYTYKCSKCGEFDIEQSIKDEPLKVCPKCGNEVKRVYKVNVNLCFEGSYNNTKR